jgi:hypothetical protein
MLLKIDEIVSGLKKATRAERPQAVPEDTEI